jgi:DNA (cytosine-5)-methyltransferase 1
MHNVLQVFKRLMMVTFKDYLTIKEASLILGVCQATLRRWDRLGKLKAIRHPINGYRLYKKDSLSILINQAINHNQK